ncbi:hypothetical protein [Streptomyces sp. ICBB 8177]|uniref:hypothetical protein n=1 Tax=Streptomyces sp. ICBB 8177 TaxID=563922 RepID=UPI000D6825E0|nr:hypothetical protein [Streptomyces sp. ICBB 8177]PWI45961.1 hypothetical protein CK485_02125 [Streptomyces sp. ICBB 8177]
MTSTQDQGSRTDVGTANLVGPNPGSCYSTLDPSYSTVNGNGIQHNVGPANGDGYYYRPA